MVATLTVQNAALAGTAITYGAATGAGDTFANTGKEVLFVKNGSASSITVTITSQINCNQGVNHPITVTIANGAEKAIGPFSTDRFNNATTGYCEIAYSAATSVTVAVVKMA